METKYPEQKFRDPVSVTGILEGHSLKRLVTKAKLILSLNNLLQEVLDDELKPHCRVMNIEGNTLILAVDSASWCTRLRYQERDILYRLCSQSTWGHLTKIQAKIRPTSST